MDLTVVIVNFNVKFFLEQCLHSAINASGHHRVEIIVVDNNSTDGSLSMIREKFPQVKIIANRKNLGFSRANNQALRIAQGRYCLLLNPDTLVEEKTFSECIGFMDDHPDAGALGVKMIDGKGNFLPESKRSLPTPLVAFFKIFGFSSLFPKSKTFNKYHLGYLRSDETHIVDILSGAFMFIRKEALEKAGYLDEDYFMYGEDIDISYRLTKAGYNNYYFPGTTIIHYKGESTKKGSINYVIVFYRAMIIFARKHFTKNNVRIFSFLIHLAIYFRALLSIIKRFIQKVYQPAIDSVLIYLGFLLTTHFWEIFRFGTREYYPELYYYYIVPLYILVWICSIYYSGGYEKPIRVWNLLKGFLTGTLIILVFYALLPENLRFSRTSILMGVIWSIPVLLLHRLFFSLFKFQDYVFSFGKKRKIIIAGNKSEFLRVAGILEETDPDIIVVGFLSDKNIEDSSCIGTTDQIRDACLVNNPDEIIFCTENIPSNEIISHISRLSDLPVEFKIAPPKGSSIIGSNSVKSTDDLYLVSFNSITTGKNLRRKRLFDIVASTILIFLSPVLILTLQDFKGKIPEAFRVLFGIKTWVGYSRDCDLSPFPAIKNSVYTLSDGAKSHRGSEHAILLNTDYARDYNIFKDINILWKNLMKINS